MKSATLLRLSKVLPLAILGGLAAALALSTIARTLEENGYARIRDERAPDIISLDPAQLHRLAPMATSGVLVMAPGSGFDMRRDRAGRLTANYGLACVELQGGETAGRLVRFRAGEVIPVTMYAVDREILEDRPWEDAAAMHADGTPLR